jgi:hypothetical protein
MIYGQLEFYNDELKSWHRRIEFYKIELRDTFGHISLFLECHTLSHTDARAGGAFTDQLMVQEQQFEHFINQISCQRQRLEQALSFEDEPIESSVTHHQDILRSRMKASERSFTNTNHNCSVYLSSFLNEGSLAV